MPASSSAPIEPPALEPLASIATCKEPNAHHALFHHRHNLAGRDDIRRPERRANFPVPPKRAKPDKAVAAKADEAKTLVEMRKKCARGHALLRMFCANESDGILTVQPAPKGQEDGCD